MLTSLLLSIFSLLLSAPSVRTAAGDYTYYVPENIPLEKAKIIALDRCKLKILAEEFGTVTGIVSSTRIKQKNGKSDIDFSQIGESEVRGEWIETMGMPKYDISYKGDMLIIKVSVRGKIRELVNASVDFDAKVLCNGTEERFERSDFKSGDELYLSFKSPTSGYLAIYLYDCDDRYQCLYPYANDVSGIGVIEGGKDYLLFSKKADTAHSVDEYVLQTDKAEEFNRLYIIFSPNKFTKAADDEGKSSDSSFLPRELSYGNFQKWLARCRKLDTEMRVEIKDLTIHSR